MTVETQDRSKYNFEAFADAAEYIEVNNQFIDRTLDVRPSMKVLDFGCGTGLAAKRVRDRLSGLPATVIGIDPNPASIAIATEQVASIGATHVRFAEGGYLTLYTDIQSQSVDTAYFLNAIHEVHDEAEQKRILAALFTSLKPGAKLGVNSTFVREWPTERKDLSDMGKLKKGSITKLEREVERAETGFISHPATHYVELLQAEGFVINVEDVRSTKVSLHANAIRAIASYDGFILGMYSDMAWADEVSIEDKYQALQERLMKWNRTPSVKARCLPLEEIGSKSLQENQRWNKN